MDGWILLHRKLLENPVTKKPLYFSLWVQLLLLASHKGNSFVFLGNRHYTNKGQFVTGRKALSELSGIPETTVERILDYFEKSGQIGQQKTTKYRLITICNWDKYQKRTTNGQQADTINNDNNGKELITHDKVVISQTVTNQITTTKMKNSFKYNENNHSDTFEDVVDLDTGVVDVPKKRIGKDKVALNCQKYFIDQVKKNTGTEVIRDSKGYFMVLDAMNKGNLTDVLLKRKVDDWFSSGLPLDQLCAITRCFSHDSINKWKVNNGIK